MLREFVLIYLAVLAVNLGSASCECLDAIPEECSRDRGLLASNRRFSYTMMRKVAKTVSNDENVCISPLVVGTMMSMILQGADGKTKQEMIEALKWQNQNKTAGFEECSCVYKYYNSFSSNLIDEEDGLQLKTANKIFGGNWDFNDDVLKTLENFGSPLEEVNFGEPAVALKHINDWVSESTNHRIQSIFPAGSLPESTVMALVSAIYFKGIWEKPFITLDGQHDFTLHSGETRSVTYMGQTGSYKFIIDRELQVLEVPYKMNKNGVCIETSMIFMLDSRGNTTRVEELLVEDGMKTLLDRVHDATPFSAIVRIPKFAITAEYDLIPILKMMNVLTLFSAGKAQLKNFIDEESRDEAPPLYVSKAFHKTYIQVDEEGTEAAGVAGAGIAPMSLPPMFIFNKPFHFMIYDRTNENILFIGRMSDPSIAK